MDRTFSALELLPPHWSSEAQDRPIRIYNPTIVCFRGRWLMAYRVDINRPRASQRRIGLCELDSNLAVIPGSVRPLSDTIQGGDPHHYDPRFLVYQDRLFVHYNNNRMTRPNQIFLVELAPGSLEAASPARPLLLEGPRQEIEKNWMLFEHDAGLFAVYQITPHIILRVDLAGTGPVRCARAYESAWNVSAYADRFGAPRGGTPPVRQGDAYVAFFHSRRPISRWQWMLRYWPWAPGTRLPRYLAAIERRLRRPLARVRYYGGAYAFTAAPPFRPLWLMPEPVLWPENEASYRSHRGANPAAEGIVYPGGAVPQSDGNWLVAYGVQDECCRLRQFRLPPVINYSAPCTSPDTIL